MIVPARRPTPTDGFAEAPTWPQAAAAEGREADRPGEASQLRKHASAGSATALAATASEAIAGKPGASAFIATTIGIKAAIDSARFFKLSEVLASGHFPITTADKASLRATLDPKTVQKVREKIEQHGGPSRVALILHGRLGPNNTVLSPGLAVNPKPQKA